MKNEPSHACGPLTIVLPIVRILGTLLFAVAIVASTGAGKVESAAQQFRESYGKPTEAISSREAGELLLKLVNAERAKHGLSQLGLSASASKLARQHADDMAAHSYVGHYDLEGRKCEQRYNALGETDHVAENIAYREVGARVRLTPQLVQSILEDWMGSKSHRRNILHLPHTRMGYGFATTATTKVTKIYAVQEFVDDWGDFSLLPGTVKPGESLTLSGTPSSDVVFYQLALGWETPPGARNPQDVGEKDLHYRQPQPQDFYLGKLGSKMKRGWSGQFPPPYPKWFLDASTENPDGSFVVPFKLPHVVKPTDLYVTVWVRGKNSKPYIDGFESSANSFTAEAPYEAGGALGSFRAMTQVIRVEPK